MRLRNYFLIAGLTVLFAALGFSFSGAGAASPASTGGAPKISQPALGDNTLCLACHQNPQFNTMLGNQKTEVFDLYVNPDEFAHSVHGEMGIACIECHVGFKPEAGHGFSFGSRREATLRLNEACGICHKTQADQEKDSVHSAARSVGKLEAAICTDCHTAHAVKRLKDPNTGLILPETRVWVPTTCQKCHSAIYEKYRNSVHGLALTDENNPDVPTCIDCHGVHIIEDPTTSAFRLKSPQLCAKCHTDPKRMDKYGISTQVLNTYVADFHGTTVTIFEKVSPDAATNKPVCYDCHGIHDIARVDDPQKGLQIKANILARCQKCHPDANTNFPDAWMSHYIPSPTKYPIVYYINLFYKFFIPAVLVPMAVLAVMDFSRMMINRFQKPKPAHAVVQPPQPVKPPSETVEQPTDVLEPPTEATEPPSEAEKQPTDAAESPAEGAEPSPEAAEPPSDAGEKPSREQPTEAAEPPSETAGQPTDAAEPPSEAFEQPSEKQIKPKSTDEEAHYD